MFCIHLHLVHVRTYSCVACIVFRMHVSLTSMFIRVISRAVFGHPTPGCCTWIVQVYLPGGARVQCTLTTNTLFFGCTRACPANSLLFCTFYAENCHMRYRSLRTFHLFFQFTFFTSPYNPVLYSAFFRLPYTTKSCPFTCGDLDPHLIHASVGPPESTSQTAS